LLRITWDRFYARHRTKAPRSSNNPRPRAIRLAWVAALVAGGGLVFWATFLVEQRLTSPTVLPTTREVSLDVVVSDAATGRAISGAGVGTDFETGDYNHPGPSWEGITDANGRFRLVQDFGANTVPGKDGKVRGRVVFTGGTFLVVRAPGYREETIYLEGRFPRGIDYEDASPRTIRVPLSPIRAP
jgi:hypothetical protein